MGKGKVRDQQHKRQYRKYRSSRRFINIGKGIPGSCCDACTIKEVCFDKCKNNCSSCDVVFCARFTNIPSKIDYENMRDFIVDIVEEMEKLKGKERCLKVEVDELESQFDCSGSTARKWLEKIFDRAKIKIEVKLNNGDMYFIGESLVKDDKDGKDIK